MGKRRDGLLVKRGNGCRMVTKAEAGMLSDDAKTRAGNRDISPALGVMLVENCAMLEEGDRSTESEDLHRTLSK